MKITFLLFALLLISACSGKKDAESDNWETPALMFKRSGEDTSDRRPVTKAFSQNLQSDDQFEFYFKGDNLQKQKSITNVSVHAICGVGENERYEEDYDLGTRAIFNAHDLLPPQALLENSKKVICQWTLTIHNPYGSTRTYSLPLTILTDDKPDVKIKISDSSHTEVNPGTTFGIESIKGMSFSIPEVGAFTSKLQCDLLSISSNTNNALLSDFTTQNSSDEAARLKNPIQRCLVEVRTNSGRIYRSSGFNFYLLPKELTKTEVTFDPAEQQIEMTNIMSLGRAVIRNDSEQPRTFGFYGPSIPYDIFFFDDQGAGGKNDDLPNKTIYNFVRKSGGQGEIIVTGTPRMTQGPEQKLVVVQPHEQIEVILRFDYYVKAGCHGGGSYSIGGLRIPLTTEIFGERAPYLDKRKQLIDLPLPGTIVHPNNAYQYFMKVVHAKLFGNPSTYNRAFNLIDRGC